MPLVTEMADVPEIAVAPVVTPAKRVTNETIIRIASKVAVLSVVWPRFEVHLEAPVREKRLDEPKKIRASSYSRAPQRK